MSRQKFLDTRVRLEVALPESLKTMMDLELWSDLEGRVPYGKTSELIVQLIREWLNSRGVVAPGLGWKVAHIPILSTPVYLAFNYLTNQSEAFFTEAEANDFVSKQKG